MNSIPGNDIPGPELSDPIESFKSNPSGLGISFTVPGYSTVYPRSGSFQYPLRPTPERKKMSGNTQLNRA